MSQTSRELRPFVFTFEVRENQGAVDVAAVTRRPSYLTVREPDDIAC